MKYLFIVLTSSFIVSWSIPDSLETKYELDRYFFIVEHWPALADKALAADTIHASAVRDSVSAGQIFFSLESAVPDSIRYEYRVRMYCPSNPDTGKWTKTGKPSRIVSGLCLDWTEGSTESVRSASWNEYDLLVVYLRTSGWLVAWRYYQGTDRIKAMYRFDFNLDSECNLSDLTFFGMDYGIHGRRIWDLSDFSELGFNYNKRSRFELYTEGR